MPSEFPPRQPIPPNIHHPHGGPHPRYHRDLTHGNPARPQRRNSPILTFTKTFSGADSVVFSARATGNGCPDRTRTVNYKGALTVFYALEAAPTKRPLLPLVGSADVRDPDQSPSHSNLGHWRTAFPWTILRPKGLTDGPSTGRADIGRTHIAGLIFARRTTCPQNRDDVALILVVELVERADAAELVVDIEGRELSITEGLDKLVKKGEMDCLAHG
ncbi:hypothetical protein BC827DRAFT_1271158 [Russula dissimulans]|nr:hypothetical protein BC827DRAFT_1271158 [Russula dissimulans]